MQGQLTDPRLAQSPGDGAADAAAAGEQRLLTCRLKTLRLGGELKADAVQHIALQTAIRQFADHIDGVESAGAGGELVDQRGGALLMRHRHQHAGHVLPATQSVEVVDYRVRGDIHRDHDAVHVLFSKVAVEVIR